MCPEFKKPPGPETLFAAIDPRGRMIWADESEPDGLPKSFEIVPYVPEWKKVAAEEEYRNLLEAGERQDEAFEDALIAVKILADALTLFDGLSEVAKKALAEAKELAPGAWIIKREEIREAEGG